MFRAISLSKLIVVVGSILLLIIVISLTREISRRLEIQKEIEPKKQKTKELEQKNQELQYLVSYLKTPSYKEKIAREKLDLQKPGEKVVIIPENTSDVYIGEEKKEEKWENQSNLLKWWHVFF